jgi:hypothetical protein
MANFTVAIGFMKPYSGCQKKRSGIQTFFSTTTYAAIPSFGTLL